MHGYSKVSQSIQSLVTSQVECSPTVAVSGLESTQFQNEGSGIRLAMGMRLWGMGIRVWRLEFGGGGGVQAFARG